MLNEEYLTKVISNAIDAINEERGSNDKIQFSQDAILFGPNGSLDSLNLVSLVMDVESSLSDYGISLTDDLAMNQEVSPLTSVREMIKYILSLNAEK